MLKKRILAAAAAAALAVSMTACAEDTPSPEGSASGGAGSTDGGGDVALTMLAAIYSDNTQGLWQGFIDEFEAANPGITISLEMQSWENINDVIKTKIQGNQAPDLLSIDAFSNYVEDDLLYSADEIVSDATISDFLPTFAQNATMDGKQYGFPLIASARALFMNNAIFEAAGLDVAAPPTTWDELKAAAEKVKALNNGTYGYCMPLGNEEAQGEFSMWVLGNGGSYGDVDTLTINSPENVEAAQYMVSLMDAGLTQPDVGSTQRTPMINNLYAQGQCAMAVGLPPFVGMFANDAPDLEYTIAPFPTKDGSRVTLGVADHLMAFDNGDPAKGEALGKFLDYFFSEKYVEFVDAEGFLPTTTSGAEGTTRTEFALFNELLLDAKFYPSTNPAWGSTQGLIQQNIGTIAQGQDPQAVLDSIQASSETGI